MASTILKAKNRLAETGSGSTRLDLATFSAIQLFKALSALANIRQTDFSQA